MLIFYKKGTSNSEKHFLLKHCIECNKTVEMLLWGWTGVVRFTKVNSHWFTPSHISFSFQPVTNQVLYSNWSGWKTKLTNDKNTYLSINYVCQIKTKTEKKNLRLQKINSSNNTKIEQLSHLFFLIHLYIIGNIYFSLMGFQGIYGNLVRSYKGGLALFWYELIFILFRFCQKV